MSKFLINGGKILQGTVTISGSKNAALPIICATLLTKEKVTLHNVPFIQDVRNMLLILEELGAKVKQRKNTVEIDCSSVATHKVTSETACKIRASLLCAGPLLGRFGKVLLAYPGGCAIGKRPIGSHLHAFRSLGCKVIQASETIDIKADKEGLKGNLIIMSETSVTGTENAIMAAVLAKGKTEIRLAAMEPHVQDLCQFLVKLGAKIQGIGTPNLTIYGVEKLKGGEYTIISDEIQAATMMLAGILTRGTVTVQNFDPSSLDAFFQKLNEIGVKYEIKKQAVTVFPTKKFLAPSRLESRIFPGFSTDLQAPFAVLLTQCQGVSKIFETLFEGRLNYLFELEKMGATVEVLNPHQALVIGPSSLTGIPVASLDLRAGAAMVLAALIAKGTTEVSNIVYIDRGYEDLEGKLRSLGADIQRVD